MPSQLSQPKLAPAARPRRRKLTSSCSSWPTSPIARSPVTRSNENRHGLRRPYAQISAARRAGRRTGCPAGPRTSPARRAARVDPQDLAQQHLQVLRVAVRIALVAAVARADVQVVVRPELQLPRVVVVVRVRDRQYDSSARRIGTVRIVGSPVLLDRQRPAQVRVVDVEQPRGDVVGREGDRQQSALAA